LAARHAHHRRLREVLAAGPAAARSHTTISSGSSISGIAEPGASGCLPGRRPGEVREERPERRILLGREKRCTTSLPSALLIADDAAQFRYALGKRAFRAVPAGLVVVTADQGIRGVLLGQYAVGHVVRVAVALCVAKLG
jgi:hypothetical protein